MARTTPIPGPWLPATNSLGSNLPGGLIPYDPRSAQVMLPHPLSCFCAQCVQERVQGILNLSTLGAQQSAALAKTVHPLFETPPKSPTIRERLQLQVDDWLKGVKLSPKGGG